MTREMFHTQEHRQEELTSPIKCYRDDAWLGEAFYFWYDKDQALESETSESLTKWLHRKRSISYLVHLGPGEFIHFQSIKKEFISEFNDLQVKDECQVTTIPNILYAMAA